MMKVPFIPLRAAAFAPSIRGVGTNTYLGSRTFAAMMGAALMVHVLVFIIMALWPEEKVKQIPVRALSFKISDPVVAAPSMPVIAAEPVSQASSSEEWVASPEQEAPKLPAPLKPVVKEKVKPPTKVKPEKRELPKLPPPPQPAIAPNPQQYVREVGAAPAQPAKAQGNVVVNEQALQAIRARYEQQISAWVQRHKLYPAEAGGREGRSVVRVRIDRTGVLRYYAIEQSSGLQALDAAALDMIRRANPMPAVPPDYPDGNLVEFLIPISFKAPQ